MMNGHLVSHFSSYLLSLSWSSTSVVVDLGYPVIFGGLSGWRLLHQPVCYHVLIVMSSHHLAGVVPCFLASPFFLCFISPLLCCSCCWLSLLAPPFYLILRFLLAIFRRVCNGLFDTVYLQPGALSIKQSSYVISRTGLIFLTIRTSFYQ
jgi:hypothetical protein